MKKKKNKEINHEGVWKVWHVEMEKCRMENENENSFEPFIVIICFVTQSHFMKIE